MTETQAKSGTAGASANPVDERGRGGRRVSDRPRGSRPGGSPRRRAVAPSSPGRRACHRRRTSLARSGEPRPTGAPRRPGPPARLASGPVRSRRSPSTLRPAAVCPPARPATPPSRSRARRAGSAPGRPSGDAGPGRATVPARATALARSRRRSGARATAASAAGSAGTATGRPRRRPGAAGAGPASAVRRGPGDRGGARGPLRRSARPPPRGSAPGPAATQADRPVVGDEVLVRRVAGAVHRGDRRDLGALPGARRDGCLRERQQQPGRPDQRQRRAATAARFKITAKGVIGSSALIGAGQRGAVHRAGHAGRVHLQRLRRPGRRHRADARRAGLSLDGRVPSGHRRRAANAAAPRGGVTGPRPRRVSRVGGSAGGTVTLLGRTGL